MTALLLQQQVDALAIAAPGERGYGYADTQHPWHHDPAIDLPRQVWLGWLEVTVRRLGRGEAVVVGIGAQPARTLSLALALGRCVAVDADAERATKLQAAAHDAGRPAAVHVVLGAGDDPLVRAAVGEAIAGCDLLLLDVQDEAALLGALLAHAPRVRDGGRVAIVDRTFEFGERLPERRADQALRQLREVVLDPADARVERHGQAVAIHDFGMDRRVRARLCLLAPPAPSPAAPASTCGDYELQRLPQAWLAWPLAAGPFRHERLWRNEAPRCWVAADEATLRERLAVADAVVAELAAAREGFVRDPAAARARVRAIAAGPAVAAAMLATLEVVPFCRELLLAAGTFELLAGEPALGAALWERAVAQQLDGTLVRSLATAYLHVLGDEAAARNLFARVQQDMRRRQIAEFCRQQPRGHVLFDYPEVLVPVTGVLQVGFGCGADDAAFRALGIATRRYVEGDAAAASALQQLVGGAAPVVAAVLDGQPGTVEMYEHADGRWSLLPPCAAAAPARSQRQIAVTTLAALVEGGRVEVRHTNLLWVAAAGNELAVLRGARSLLVQFDVLCVQVWPKPVFAGAPQPQDVQGWLRGLGDDDGFVLRAFQPAADVQSGIALFRRVRRRA
jgi:hypothetical protein